VAIGAGLFFVASTVDLSQWRADLSEWGALLDFKYAPAASAVPPARDAGLALPRRGETALAHARTLAAAHQLQEALRALDLIRPTDTQKADADLLRADIQRQLLKADRYPQ
jgi:hypothetical protein